MIRFGRGWNTEHSQEETEKRKKETVNPDGPGGDRQSSMEEMNRSIDALIDCVKRSETYREYMRQQQIINADPALAARVNAFRADNFRSQSRADTAEQLDDVVTKIFYESYELRKDPVVNAYLDAELALCRLLQKIVRRLTDGIEMEIPEDL